jgi:hypothetical protein
MRNIIRFGSVFAFRHGDIVPCARDEGSNKKAEGS